MKSILKLTAVVLLLAAALPALAADVKPVWDKNCAKCHGQDGKGNTRMGKQSGVKDYTDAKVQADLKDDSAMKAMKEGITEGDKKKMDPYKEKLSEQEMKDLLAYMRAFKK